MVGVSMELRARLVLQDLRAAAGELPDGPGDLQDEGTIRRRVLAVMALVRAVGHVLGYVDRKRSQVLRAAIDAKWDETQNTKPEIWSFISGYRAAVTKRYEQPDVDFELIMGTEFPVLEVDLPAWGGPIPFIGLVQMAIDFWEDYLTDVERRAGM